MIAIMGATGNVGSKLSHNLLRRGKKVRVIGRAAQKLKTLAAEGAETAVGDIRSTNFLTEAFTNAGAVFALIPPDYTAENFRAYSNEIGASIAEAIKNAQVEHVVNLSSTGAHLSEGVGPIKGLFDQEQRLNKLEGVHILHLRPTYFMENLLDSIDLIKNMGINGGAIRGDLKFSMIATQDIAEVAAEVLSTLDFTGKRAQELYGERDLSMDEATRIIGSKIGKSDLNYVQFPYEEFKKSLLQIGLSEDVSDQLVEMSQALNEGVLGASKERTSENTTGTSFEEFAELFAQVYNG
ncbi:NmrA family NAD(P)-binding protein [bacterium]|nr:NmrA family NAD(P)-binding protein [bacterium]